MAVLDMALHEMLDPIHNQGLRLASGAFRTSPVATLYVEADEPSLYSRREPIMPYRKYHCIIRSFIAIFCSVKEHVQSSGIALRN